MLHRVLTSANGAYTSSTTFTSILHAAAGRAWLRTAPNVTAYNTSEKVQKNSVATAHSLLNSDNESLNLKGGESSVKSPPKSCALPLREQPPAPSTLQPVPNNNEDKGLKPTPKVAELHRPTATTPSIPCIHPKQPPHSLPDSPLCSVAQNPAAPPGKPRPFVHAWSPEFAAECTSVGPGPPLTAEYFERVLPLAKSKGSLYRNLLHLTTQIRPTPSFAQIFDYHDQHPGFRSARSYNLVLSLALRHSAYGTAQWLFSAMKAEEIPYTLDTYKLRARFLARLGRWDDVVKEFNLAPTSASRSQPTIDIPVSIWVELLQARTTIVQGHKHLRNPDHIEGGNTGITQEAAQQLATTYESRFGFLMRNTPDIATQNLSSNQPRVVASLVTALLKCGQRQLALSLARSYLTGLPSRIPERDARQCLHIIHPLVAHFSTQKSLPKFFESRKILRSLLRLHQSLRPTSSTLLLLLSSLTGAKRCGTVASSCIEEFRKLWGDSVLDRRVMLRLASFAVKEGRMDLFDDVSESETLGSWQRWMWQLKGRTIGEAAIPPQHLLRPQTKKFLPHNGREQRKWCLIANRVRRKKKGGKLGRVALTVSTEP